MRRSFLLFGAVIGILASAIAITQVQAHFEAHPLSKISIENIKEHRTANANGGSITIEATVLNGTGNFVTISWKNLPSPYPGNFDWIGVYSPKPDDWTKITPAKYKYVISDETGSGSTVFWLLNMRSGTNHTSARTSSDAL